MDSDEFTENSSSYVLNFASNYVTTIVAVTAVGILALAVFREVLRLFKRPQPIEPEDSMANSESSANTPITEAELRAATGEDGAPLLIAVKNPFGEEITVFDVSIGSDFYGPGGPYHCFAGKNASHGLATSSTDPEKAEGDLSSLTQMEKDTLAQWHSKYMSKYQVVGKLVKDAEAAAAITQEDTESFLTTESKKDA